MPQTAKPVNAPPSTTLVVFIVSFDPTDAKARSTTRTGTKKDIIVNPALYTSCSWGWSSPRTMARSPMKCIDQMEIPPIENEEPRRRNLALSDNIEDQSTILTNYNILSSPFFG